jgi:hypothetical protein
MAASDKQQDAAAAVSKRLVFLIVMPVIPPV